MWVTNMNELRKALYDAIENNIVAMVDQGQPYLHWTGEPVEEVIDAILQALPEEKTKLDSIDQHEMGYNTALNDVRTILEEAKS